MRLLLFFLSFLLSSCVLTMEDYTQVPEEERGVGAPYTYKDSLVTATYEFNPGVLPLPTEALDYVAAAQDSTIYFFDNIPDKWLPKKGGYVSAAISRLFPSGLGHRVLDVQHANGMYAVTLTAATKDEIFKELNIQMTLGGYHVPGYYIEEDVPDTLYDDDGNVVDIIWSDTTQRNNAPYSGLRRFTRADAGGTSLELAADGHNIIDWRYVDAAMAAKGLSTRAEEGTVKDTIYETEHKFEVSRDNLSFSYEWKELNVTTITSYYEEDTKKKTSKQWSQTEYNKTTTFKGGIQFQGGLDADQLFAKDTKYIDPAVRRKIYELVKKGQQLKSRMTRYNPKLHNLEIPFAIGPVPCAFIIKFDASISATVGGFVNSEQTNKSDVWRTTIVTKGKEETKSKKLIKKGEQDKNTVSFIGSGGVEFNARVGVGAMVGIRGTGVGIDVGGGLKGGLKFEVEPTIYSNSTEGVTDARVTAEMSVYVDIEAFMDLFGNNVWGGRYTFFENKFIDKAWHFAPLVDAKKTNGTYTYIYDSKSNITVHHKRKLCFSQLWTGWFEKEGAIRPVMRVYKGDYEDYDYTELQPINSSAGKKSEYIATPKVVYDFEYDSQLGKVLHFVPALYVENEQKTYELRYMEVVMGEESDDPRVQHMDAYQETVDEEKDYWEDRNGEQYDTYRITDVVRLENVSRIAEVGVYVNLQDAKGRQQFKNLKIKLLESTNLDMPIRTGDYKFHLKLSIPASGRWHYFFEQSETMPIYPVITIRPYAIIWRGPERGEEEEKYSSKQFNLKYPYTNTHNYSGGINVDM